jgi:hypothetical protein
MMMIWASFFHFFPLYVSHVWTIGRKVAKFHTQKENPHHVPLKRRSLSCLREQLPLSSNFLMEERMKLPQGTISLEEQVPECLIKKIQGVKFVQIKHYLCHWKVLKT